MCVKGLSDTKIFCYHWRDLWKLSLLMWAIKYVDAHHQGVCDTMSIPQRGKLILFAYSTEDNSNFSLSLLQKNAKSLFMWFSHFIWGFIIKLFS